MAKIAFIGESKEEVTFYNVFNDCLFSLLQGNARNCETKSLIKINTSFPRIFITLKNKKIYEKVQVKKKKKTEEK